MPDPSFHGWILKKTSRKPEVGPKGRNLVKRLTRRKRRLIPLGYRTRVCVCVCDCVFEVHKKLVSCTFRSCGGSDPVRLPQACQYLRALRRAGMSLTSLLNKGFFVESARSCHVLRWIWPHAFTQ